MPYLFHHTLSGDPDSQLPIPSVATAGQTVELPNGIIIQIQDSDDGSSIYDYFGENLRDVSYFLRADSLGIGVKNQWLILGVGVLFVFSLWKGRN